MKRIIITLAGIVFILSDLYSQMSIPGGNVSGIWTMEDSPYLIYGDITVPAGATLVIEPGVKVVFQGFYKLDVEGQLFAVGNKDNMITFTINDTTEYSDENATNGGWHGIRFENNNSPDTSKIIYCKIEYEKYVNGQGYSGGVYINNFSKVVIKNNFFAKNNTGINLKNASIINIVNNIFYKNIKGAKIDSSDKSIFFNNLIVNNSMGAYLFQVNNIYIINNLICNNSTGLWMVFSHCDDIIFANNTISNNFLQIHIDELDTTVLFYNTILWGSNTTNVDITNSSASFYYCDIQNGINSLPADAGYVHDYENNIEDYPDFVNPTQGIGSNYDALNANWHLKSTSPCIDAGTPDTSGLHLTSTDVTGNQRIYNGRIDIGAYEYNGQEDVTNISSTDNYINVFPNPSKDNIIIFGIFDNKINSNLKIISINGKTIYKKTYKNTNQITEHLNISNYEKGVYIVKITGEKVDFTKKIIIQ